MIKLFACDVDGTLTDGFYNTTEKGEVSKNFFTRDFHGLWMLNQMGVKVCIITAGIDEAIDHQCRRGAKCIDIIIKGAKDKVASIDDKYVFDVTSDVNSSFGEQNCLYGSGRLYWSEIAYIGDDIFDIELLSTVGLCSCPSDADKEVVKIVSTRQELNSAGFYSSFPGGRGSVREFAEYVLEINRAGRE